MTAFTCLLFSGSARAQLYLNGRAAAYDSLTSTYLFSVDESLFDEGSYVATITLDADSAWSNVSIEGADIATGDTLRLNLTGGGYSSLTARRPDGSDVSAGISFTCMPIVSLRGDFGYDYSEGTVSLYMPYASDETDEDCCEMSAKLKWRGGVTNQPLRQKRNYHIKFLKEDGTKKNRQFFGLRKDNDWILDANQIDLGRCRNRIATDLWNETFATSPYYADSEPEALSGTRGRMVEVFLNDEYRGIYAMTENVDAKQMCLVDYDEDTETQHGHLWKTTSYTDATMMLASMAFDGTLEECNGFDTKHPDFDDVSPTDYSIIANAVRFVAESSDEDFSDSVTVYFDMPVMVNYFIFLNVTQAVDNNSKNLFYACYDEQESTMLTPAVWDLDCTFGQYFTDGVGFFHMSTLGPEVDYMSTWNDSNLFGRLAELDWFNSMVSDRYNALRDSGMTAESIAERFETMIGMYIKCGAAAREATRWNGCYDISYRELDFDGELEFIVDWISRRIVYLDGLFLTEAVSAVPAIRTDNDATFSISGRRVDSRNLQPGIYIRNGKKFIVR